MKKYLTIVFLLLHFIANSQIPIEQDESSDVDNLRKSQSEIVSNNLSTGEATVNIPVYDYKLDGFNVGVSLNYKTSGIKVDQAATYVGLGWDLNAAPKVTRQVRGFEDERRVEYQDANTNVNAPAANDWGYWSHRALINPHLTNSNYIDPEADVFYFQLFDRFLTVVFSKEGQYRVIPADNQISILAYVGSTDIAFSAPPANSNDALSFVVIDKGNKYYFSRGVIAQKTITDRLPNVPPFPQAVPYTISIVSEWKLDKFISVNGNVIDYLYTTQNYIDKTFNQKVYISEGQNLVFKAHDEWNSLNTIHFLPMKTTYPNGMNVEFFYDASPRLDIPGANRLSLVKISEKAPQYGAATVSRSFGFNYAYFQSPDHFFQCTGNSVEFPINGNSTLLDTRFRLKLKSIVAQGTDNVVKDYYKFDYYNYELPERLVGARDYFGYANGATMQSFNSPYTNCLYGLITPKYTSTTINYGIVDIGIDMTPTSNISTIAAGTLETITNSNGGKTKLSYWKVGDANANDNVNGSGLLLKEQTNYDGYNINNDVIKKYEYENGENLVYGEGPMIPETHLQDYSLATCSTGVGWSDMKVTESGKQFVMNEALNGSSHIYKKATEKICDGSSNVINKNIYTFKGVGSSGSPDYGGFPLIVTNYSPPNGECFQPNNCFQLDFNAHHTNKQYVKTWIVGLLEKLEQYDKDNYLLSSTEYEYEYNTLNYLTSGYYYNNSDDWENVNVGYTHNNSPTWFEPYFTFTGWSHLKSVNTKTYINNSEFIENVTEYKYKIEHLNNWELNYDDIYEISTTSSLGKVIKQRYIYDYELVDYILTTPYFDVGSAILKTRQLNQHRLIYIEKWKGISSNLKLYELNFSTPSFIKTPPTNNTLIRPKYRYKLSSTSLLDTTQYKNPTSFDNEGLCNGTANAYLKKISEAVSYDSKGNEIETLLSGSLPIVGSSSLSGRAARTSKIYDTTTGNLLAVVENASYNDIAYCGFESNIYGAGNDNNGNWNFDPAAISTVQQLTGRYSYKLASANSIVFENAKTLTAGTDYVVTLWRYGTSTCDVKYNGVTLTKNQIFSFGSWRLYHVYFTAVANQKLSITGTAYIDDVRLYPTYSRMNTFTYHPLFGISATSDENDKLHFYEYDGFGNVISEKNQDGNILFKKQFAVQEQD